jgi:quercetin dioxygenase-like cupin family protein
MIPDRPQIDNLVYDLDNDVVYLEDLIMTLEPLVRAGHTRRTETPNATMTTLASPTLGGSAGLSVWQVEMAPGSRGPLHVFDSEQVWTVLDGAIAVTADGVRHELGAGDTIVLRAGVTRQVEAEPEARILVCGRGDAVVSVPGEQDDRGTPPWIG